MTRPLRINMENGWYHVTARGIERRTIYHSRKYYEHFLGLLEEMSDRYGVEIHAYVLMKNHYHLIVRTPNANLSACLQWLNVSYSAWYNAAKQRVGHVFQGRFKSNLIDGNGSWLLEASAYLHLNPVRIETLGLDKQTNRAEAKGLITPSPAMIRGRIEALRDYVWSSYGGYAGYREFPDWLQWRVLSSRAGGKEAYANYVESFIRRGSKGDENYIRLKDHLLLGSKTFCEKMKKLVTVISKEQPERRQFKQIVAIENIIKVVEEERSEKWEEFKSKRGDTGRDLVLYLGRKKSGLTLRELGEVVGGMDYKTVDKAVKRIEQRKEKDKSLAKVVKRSLSKIAIFET